MVVPRIERGVLQRDHDRRELRTTLLDGARSPIVGTADAAYFTSLRDRAGTDT